MTLRRQLDVAAHWQARGTRVAVATVIATWGSSPRPIGSRLFVASSGERDGSVSGGCVENAVVDAAVRVLEQDEPTLLSFGIDDGRAWSVGLPCGGTIEVVVQVLPDVDDDPAWGTLRSALESGTPVTFWTDIEDLDAGSRIAPEAALPTDAPPRAGARVEEREGRRVLVESFLPPPRLVVVGAVHLARPLLALAAHTTCRRVLVDPRTALLSDDAFQDVEERLEAEPGDAIAGLDLLPGEGIVTLTHEPRFDLTAIRAGLAVPGVYLGALGSKRTHARRLTALREEGFPEGDLARIHGPIGLDLGGRQPEEIAVAILAEWVAFRHGRSRSGAAPSTSPA